MMKEIFDMYHKYINVNDGDLITFLYINIGFTILVLIGLIILHIVNEVNLIKRDSKKTFFYIDDYIEVSKNYDFEKFLFYNMYMLFDKGMILLCATFAFGLMQFILFLVLGVLAGLEFIIILINIWLLIPVTILILKYLLYYISKRYKK